jgi:hypothetical protein
LFWTYRYKPNTRSRPERTIAPEHRRAALHSQVSPITATCYAAGRKSRDIVPNQPCHARGELRVRHGSEYGPGSL